MKNLFKILLVLISYSFIVNTGFALNIGKIDKFINKSEINETSTVAISIKNAENNSTVYEQNQNKLLHPASTLKLFSTYSALDVLGYNYNFKTKFYKDKQNNLYIKLGADPLLTTHQLKSAFQAIKATGKTSFKNLYFDDSIIDKKEFSQGWMWDDDINPYTPKVSAYNIDENTVKLAIEKSANGAVLTSLKSTYPMSVVSFIQTDNKQNLLDVNRYNWSNPEVVEIYGNINDSTTVNIPISSMRRYFIHNVEKAIEENKITFSETLYSSKIVPDSAELITEISNPIEKTIPLILQNSNNLMSETIYKLAGGQLYSSTGTDELATKALKEFYKEMDINSENIIIKDGCGVSRNNLVYADWMTNVLNKLYKRNDFNQFKDYMAQPGDGTLSSRLYDLRGEAWFKTGSLSNVSAIVGYINSRDGKTYSFAILTQNFNLPQKQIKDFEDEIINMIYYAK